MIVELGDLTVSSERARLAAAVCWEQADRDPVVLFIESSVPEAIVHRIEAFLPACAVIAQLTGEHRLTADSAVSPLFRESLPTALAWTRHLSRSSRPPLDLQLTVDSESLPERPPRHGQFFSGGVDSMATLCLNHRLVPPGHPHRITDLIYVRAFEEESNTRAVDGVRAVAREVGVGLVEVRTNLATLDTPDRRYWQEFFYGSYLASVAQAHAARFTRVTIAPSSGTIGPTKRLGSLPQLDENFSSDQLVISHPHFEMTRDERISVLADWGPGRRWVRPCSKRGDRQLNCGTCEKCVPTQIAILAAGHDLGDFPCFDVTDLDPALIRSFRVFDPEIVDVMAEVHAPQLFARGRKDLSDAILEMRDGFMTWNVWRDRAIAEVVAVVPDAELLQVVDLGQFALPDPLGERPIRWHWAVPACTDDSAREFGRMVRKERDAGAHHLAIFSSAFWWFETYPWLEPLLEELGTELVATERVRVFRLS